jgi:hypothetical protein
MTWIIETSQTESSGTTGNTTAKPDPVARQVSYTVDEIVGILSKIAIKQNYIKREYLTTKGEVLVSAAERQEQIDDFE